MNVFFTPFKVGLLVILSSVSLIWMSQQVKKGIDDDDSLIRVYALFKDVSGLAIRSKVVIAGITVGQIDHIELAGDQAKVWIKVKVQLKTDARIAKRQASLLGESFLQLTPGYQGSSLRNEDEIKQVDYDVSPADIMQDVRKVMTNVQDITYSLKNVLAGENGEIRLASILENVNKVVEQMNKTLSGSTPKIDKVIDQVAETVKHAKNLTANFRSKADIILNNAQQVSQNTRMITEDVLSTVRDYTSDNKKNKLNQTIKRINSALKRLDSTLAHGKSIVQKIDEGKGSIGQLINNDHLVNSIGRLVDDSSRFINRLTRLQFQIAMRSEYYFQNQVSKNYLELRLIPKPDKYYVLQLIDSPSKHNTMVDRVLTRNVDGTQTVIRESEQTTEDRFLISLQFAKRFHFLTGRIGILESSGSLGLDVSLLRNSLTIYSDLFEFAKNRNPRLRFRASYEFFKHLYIAAGVDDVMNHGEMDYFIGGGLRFNDEDLQAILTAAPVPSID